MIATLSTNHHDLSDWLLLIAVIAFVLHAVLIWIGNVPARFAALTPIGLALVSLALFVT